MARCRGCGAAIEWVVTRQGKRMPVNPIPVRITSMESLEGLRVVGATADGRVVSGYRSPAGEREVRQVHFATCPKAEEARRG